MTSEPEEKKTDGGAGEEKGNSTRADPEGTSPPHCPVSGESSDPRRDDNASE